MSSFDPKLCEQQVKNRKTTGSSNFLPYQTRKTTWKLLSEKVLSLNQSAIYGVCHLNTMMFLKKTFMFFFTTSMFFGITFMFFRITLMFFRKTSMLCRKTSMLCRTTSMFLRTTSMLCRTTSMLCQTTSMLYQNTFMLYRKTSMLYRTTSLRPPPSFKYFNGAILTLSHMLRSQHQKRCVVLFLRI